MSNNNINKYLEELYPNLSWDESYVCIIKIIDTENKCSQYFSSKYSNYIKIWEYGYYYLTLMLQNSKFHKSYAPLIALYSESLTSLRCSFQCNINGYHPEAISLLRRVHECCTKLIASKTFPKKIWDIVQSSSLQKAESDLGINLKWLYRLESSFLHSNKLKIIIKGIESQKEKVVSIPYGSQLNDKEYLVAANISIFWIYVLALIAPRLFPDQLPDFWLVKHNDSCKLFKDYLNNTKSKLVGAAEQIENILGKIGPESYKIKKN